MNYQQFINAVKQEMKGSVAGEIEISGLSVSKPHSFISAVTIESDFHLKL